MERRIVDIVPVLSWRFNKYLRLMTNWDGLAVKHKLATLQQVSSPDNEYEAIVSFSC